jgi:PEP-CTERM motif
MKKLSILLASAALLATASVSQAGPITLDTTAVTQMKFQNFENLINNNGDGFINTGDQFQGIFQVTSNGTIAFPNENTLQLLTTTDLYGTFLITVAGGSIPNVPGGSGTITFNLSTPGDYINLYTAPVGTYAPNLGTTANLTISDLNGAGTLWASITGTDYIFGENISSSGSSNNYNWANLTVNNTGYDIVPLLWPASNGNIAFPTQLVTQIYFQDILSNNSNPLSTTTEWAFSSQDPLNLRAIAVVPEPGTFALVGFGLLGAGFFARRRNKK